MFSDKIIVCPDCKGTFSDLKQDFVVCGKCDKKYKIQNNVPNLKICAVQDNLSAKEDAELEFWISRDNKKEECAFKRIEKRHSLNFEGYDFKDKIMIDIGAGPHGGMLEKFKSRNSFAIDVLADRYAQNFDFSDYKVNYICAEAEYLPFRDNSVDLALALNSIDHVANIFKAFLEINRVLKEDGTFICSSLYNSHPFSETEPFVFDDEFIKNELPKFFDIIEYNYNLFDQKLQNSDGLYKAVCKKKKNIEFKEIDLLDKYTSFIKSYCCALKSYMDKSELSLEYTQKAITEYIKLHKQDDYKLLLLKLKSLILQNDENIFDELEKIDRNYFNNNNWNLAINHKISTDIIKYRNDEKILKFLESSLTMSEQLNIEYRKGISLFYLGEYYFDRKIQDKAIDFYRQCLDIIPSSWSIALEASNKLCNLT